jgi:putative flippase GtrA
MGLDGMSGSTIAGSKGLTLKYCAVSMCGLAINIAVLRLLTGWGLQPAYAQALSLLAAVQATFWLNGVFVFHCVTWRRWGRQWLAYMGASGFGLVCNSLIFNALLSLHRPVVSNQMFAVCAGAFAAWGVNYTAARLVVFNLKLHRRIGALVSDAEAARSALKLRP